MRYLGLDVGQKKIGVAIGETLVVELVTLICPKETTFYEDRGYKYALSEIKRLIDLEEISALVIGLPVSEDGNPTEESKRIKKFANKLEDNLNLLIHFVDETLTSIIAEELLSSQDLSKDEIHQRVHQAAAQQILQQYVEDNG